ncbi:glutathione synthetase [Elysia marginata]|uniref:Glutathione synthetase n=1 Tax=Elysia marginata TaxID=1093978 RepID=A0AAV4H9P8_9GAST|nr:glutathione synthetase [Elysia marginata]
MQISQKRLKEISDIANAWAVSNGVSFKADREGPGNNEVLPTPYTLFPALVPAPIFEQARSSMTEFSRLVHKVANDHNFLTQCLEKVVEVDPFMNGLWNIYLKVREAGIKQSLMLGVFRNDFMMAVKENRKPGGIMKAEDLELKHIEINVISASFGGLVQQLTKLHKLTLNLCGKKFNSEEMPGNKPANGIAKGLLKAWQLYNNPQSVIVFLVAAKENNSIDQRWIEFEIYKQNPGVRVLRRTFADFRERGSLSCGSHLLIDDQEVAVVYMRDGETAENYTSEKEWNGRLIIELSAAIKSPCVQYQLVGSKKVQQELARPGVLEKFVPSKESVEILKATFADQFSVDLGPEGDKAVEMALASPEKFVLKPQREGGGHNLFDTEMATFLSHHISSKERNAYILMQRIYPWQQQNYLVKSASPFNLSEVVSELGIYGIYLGSCTADEFENYECGHLMKTKTSGTNNSGVVAGLAGLDTAFIYDPFICESNNL